MHLIHFVIEFWWCRVDKFLGHLKGLCPVHGLRYLYFFWFVLKNQPGGDSMRSKYVAVKMFYKVIFDCYFLFYSLTQEEALL